MIPIASGVRVWIATGHTDMRRGMNGLALLVQEGLKRDPHAGDLYIFRGRRGQLTTFHIQFAMCDDCVSVVMAEDNARMIEPTKKIVSGLQFRVHPEWMEAMGI